jgi:diguanylate cyclase (GGDEF)-like protein
MARSLRLYDLLHRLLQYLDLTLSFRAKVALAVLTSVLLPLGAMEFYFILYMPLRGVEQQRLIWVGVLAAMGAAVLGYWTLSTILRPLADTSKQLNQYLADRTMPDLPMHYKDEMGLLMANINYLTLRLEEHVSHFQENAAFDHLTGVYNRRASESRLKDSIELSRIRQNRLSFALLDLDYFKEMNDGFGHDFGDEVLRHLGELLRQNIRRSDWVGRWGGDEFVIAIHGGETEAVAMVSRLCEVVRREPVEAPDRTFKRLSLSVGVCEWSDNMDAHALYTKADEALYLAKRQGRDQVQIWSEAAV